MLSPHVVNKSFSYLIGDTMKPSYRLGVEQSNLDVYTSHDFERLALSYLKFFEIDFTIYLGAHAGYWIKPILTSVAKSKFLCFEANPVVYNRYKKKLASIPGVEYENSAVALEDGTVTLFIPSRRASKETPIRKLDSKLFRNFHESFSREREGWETEATILDKPTSLIAKSVTVNSISLLTIFKRISREGNLFLLMDLEGFDFQLLKANTDLLYRFDAICFEHHFTEQSDKRTQVNLIRSTLDSLGFSLLCIGADSDNSDLANFFFFKRNMCSDRHLTLIQDSASKLTFEYWQYSPSLASKLSHLPGKSILLRLLSLIGMDIFKSG